MRVVKAFCLAYSSLVWQLISPTALKHLTGLAEVNSSFICPSCSWSGEWQKCFSSVWALLSFLFPLSCAVVWNLGKLVSFLPAAFSPGSGQHPSALAPAPYSCELPLLKPFAPDQAAGCWGPSGFALTPFPVIFSLLLLQLARLFTALLASTFCFPSTLPFQPPSSPGVLATAGLLSGCFLDTTSLCALFTPCPVPKTAEYPHPEGRDVFFVSHSFKMPLASFYWWWPCLTNDIDPAQWGDTPDIYQPLPPQWPRGSRPSSYSPVGYHCWIGEEKSVCFANYHPRSSLVVGGTQSVAPVGFVCHTIWGATTIAFSGKAGSRQYTPGRPAIATGWEIWVFSWCTLRWQQWRTAMKDSKEQYLNLDDLYIFPCGVIILRPLCFVSPHP